MITWVPLLCIFVSVNYGINWAVLVSGSKGFSNYRHQSDVGRMYSLLLKNGIKNENIICMVHDDIAFNRQNPFPGKIFNEPDGPDVSLGSDVISYRENNVNAQIFKSVLLGDSLHGQKVLKSNQEDDVFIFFSDRGAPGFLSFPNGPHLYADELISILKKMHEKKMFRKLVILVDSAYSSSLFDGLLPEDINVMAITTATDQNSSTAYYCNNPKYKACLTSTIIHHMMNSFDSVGIRNTNLDCTLNNLKKQTIFSSLRWFGSCDKEKSLNCKKDIYKNKNTLGEGVTSRYSKEEAYQVISPHSSSSSSVMFPLDKKNEEVYPTIKGEEQEKSENEQHGEIPQCEAEENYLKTAAEHSPFGNEALSYHERIVQLHIEKEKGKKMKKFFESVFDNESEKSNNMIDQKKLEPKTKSAFTSLIEELDESTIDNSDINHNEGKALLNGHKVDVSFALFDFRMYKSAIEMYEEKNGFLCDSGFWIIPSIIAEAVSTKKLTTKNFDKYCQMLDELAKMNG